MANSLPTQSSSALVVIGLGYITFGALLSAMLFMLDMANMDKDVDISQDHGQYWLGIPAFLLGVYVLFSRNQMSNASKCVRIFFSVYCFIASVICIILEGSDWMRYLSDNRSPDDVCKLALIAVPKLQQEMDNSEYFCSRRSSYAWCIGFVMVSAVLLINFSVCSSLLHVWIAIREEMTYKLPDYPAFTCTKTQNSTRNKHTNTGSSNRGFEEN